MTRRCGDCQWWTGDALSSQGGACYGVPPTPVMGNDKMLSNARPTTQFNTQGCSLHHPHETGPDRRPKT